MHWTADGLDILTLFVSFTNGDEYAISNSQ